MGVGVGVSAYASGVCSTWVHTCSCSSASRVALSSSLSELGLLSLSSLSLLGSLSDDEDEEDEEEEWAPREAGAADGSSGILAKQNSNTSCRGRGGGY